MTGVSINQPRKGGHEPGKHLFIWQATIPTKTLSKIFIGILNKNVGNN
jgi:hypothetical protein